MDSTELFSRSRRLATIAVVLVVATAASMVTTVGLGAGPAAAVDNPTSCTRSLTGNVQGPVNVTSGQLVCIDHAVVSGTNVNGSAINLAGGGLVLTSSVVNGNINSNAAFVLVVCASSVRSFISVGATSGYTVVGWRANNCGGNALAGALNLNGNPGPVVADANQVGTSTNPAHFDLLSNTGGVSVTSNVVSDVLNCSGNNPAPSGGGNVASKGKLGQCAAL